MYRPFDIVMIIICGVSLLIMIPLLFYILWILLKDWLRHRKHAKNSGAKGTMDPDPSLMAGASMLYLATRSRSRSRKTEPRHDWIEEEECLDYAALDEDFKEEVEEFFDREDYDF